MIIHDLKSLPEYFHAVWRGDKTFEVRKNDREFHEGDYLILKEWSPIDDYSRPPWMQTEPQYGHSGGVIIARINYTTNFEQKEGYIVLGIEVLQKHNLLALGEKSQCVEARRS